MPRKKGDNTWLLANGCGGSEDLQNLLGPSDLQGMPGGSYM